MKALKSNSDIASSNKPRRPKSPYKDSLDHQRTELTKTRTSLAQLELAKRQGNLIDRESVIEQQIERELICKRAFMGLPRATVPKMLGKGAIEMEAILTEAIFEALRKLARRK